MECVAGRGELLEPDRSPASGGRHRFLLRRLRAQLMLALYRSDRQADALQAYQNARRTLVKELGIEPGERLRRLERAVLAQDPGLQLPASEEPAAAVARAERLRGPRARAGGAGRRPRGCLCRPRAPVLLGGEPGIGKSRLADELMGYARARGARVLVGRCWEAGGAPAYWPWVQALRRYLRETDREALRAQLGEAGADVAAVLPEVRDLLPDLPPPPAVDSDGARFRLLESVAAFLRNAASATPLALFLDDLHAGGRLLAAPPALRRRSARPARRS